MSKFNIGEFLSSRKSIMSYIYDAYGFKRGIIVATPGCSEEKQPHIGYAFFDEVVPRVIAMGKEGCMGVYREKFYGRITDIPLYRDVFSKNGLDVDAKEVKNLPKMLFEEVDYPYYNEARAEGSDEDYIKECLLLAYRRANGNFSNYYITDNKGDVQRKSYLGNNEGSQDGEGVVRLKICNPICVNPCRNCEVSDRAWTDSIDDLHHLRAIRHKIKQFEYRALKYYRYLDN